LVVRRAAQDFGDMQLKLAEAAAIAIGAPPPDADYANITEATKIWITSLGLPAQRVMSAFGDLNGQGPWSFAKLMLISAEFNALASAVR
jgi:hypothetical protein